MALTIKQVKEDLENLGITPFDGEDGGAEYLNFGLDIGHEYPINVFIKISGEFLAVSTIELFTVGKNDLEDILKAQDDIPLGKYFLSKDLNTDIDADELYLDYGFEIPTKVYSKEFLELNLEIMVETLQNNM